MKRITSTVFLKAIVYQLEITRVLKGDKLIHMKIKSKLCLH